MSVRTILIVALALMFGGAAAIGINAIRNQPQANAGSKDEATVPVVIAVKDIEPFVKISREMITTKQYPKDKGLVPSNAISSEDDVIGRAATFPISRDEPVLDSKLTTKGSEGLSGLVPPGMRAVTIPTPNIAAGVAGFVLPHSKVDVVSGLASDDKPGKSSPPLLQNVEIIAVNTEIVSPAGSKFDPNNLRSVTVLVTMPQADKVIKCMSKGAVYLTLRNSNDSKVDVEEDPEEPAVRVIPINTMKGGVSGVVKVYTAAPAKDKAPADNEKKPDGPTPPSDDK